MNNIKRKTISSIKIKRKDILCSEISPVLDSDKIDKKLKTMGFALSNEQAIQMAKLLLIASDSWEKMVLTIYRKKRKDGKFQMTLTNP